MKKNLKNKNTRLIQLLCDTWLGLLLGFLLYHLLNVCKCMLTTKQTVKSTKGEAVIKDNIAYSPSVIGNHNHDHTDECTTCNEPFWTRDYESDILVKTRDITKDYGTPLVEDYWHNLEPR